MENRPEEKFFEVLMSLKKRSDKEKFAKVLEDFSSEDLISLFWETFGFGDEDPDENVRRSLGLEIKRREFMEICLKFQGCLEILGFNNENLEIRKHIETSS